MKTVIASIAAALALSFASPLVVSDAALAKAKKPTAQLCKIGKGKKAQTWKCAPGQACCVGADGKGVCGMEGLGCL